MFGLINYDDETMLVMINDDIGLMTIYSTDNIQLFISS